MSKRKRVGEDLAAVVPTLPMTGALDQAGLEALGLAQEQARRRESTGSLSSKYWLSLLPQPPRHPFVRSYFPLKVVLVDSKRVLKSGWTIELGVELLYENGEVVPNQAANVEVHGHDASRPIILTGTGSVDLKVRILACSMAHENKNFFLRFTGVPTDKNVPSYVTIMPATSTLMTVIRHRLTITEQPPSLWYKDEGGREKCISISGLLVDEHEQPVQGREVPLKVLLCYEGEECTEVKNQSILKMPTDSVPKVDKFGKVSLRVRIEEVSKNHQKQAFVIQIAPDIAFSTDNFDISADVSSPVTVLSKRNKRRPKRGDGGDDDSPEGPQPVHAGNLFQPPVFSLPAAAATMPLGFTKMQQLAVPSSITGPLALASSSVLPTITPTGAAAHPASGIASTSLSGANMTRIVSRDGQAHLVSEASEYKPNATPSFSDTISHLVNWCQHVHDLLTKIEWQHVGFEVQDNGQMNLHRPLYRCPGCWSYQDTVRQTGHKESCKISKLSSAYRTHVHIYLQDLLNMAAASGGSGMPSAPPAVGSTPSQMGGSQMGGSNSLMAAYSKNNGGNLFLSHSNSQSARPFPLPSGASAILATGGPLSLVHQSSTMSLARSSTPAKADAGAGALGGDNGSAAKKAKSDPTSVLFPPSSTDWANLAPVEPLSSPNALMDRGLSVLDQANLAERHATMAGFYPESNANAAAAAADFMTDLPTESLSLLRAGSSIRLEAMLADNSDESAVDAIHVTATPFGFPTFSAASTSGATPTAAQLLGFFQYDESTTFLVFVPLARFQVTPVQVKEMERIYRQLRDHDGEGNAHSRILTRAQCITLDKLKEEALLLHYASQASGYLTSETF